MDENKPNTVQDWVDPDDAPDLSTPEWRKVFENTPVTRGRPMSEQTKLSTTIRLDGDIIAHFRAGGDGWQTRINAALREWMQQR